VRNYFVSPKENYSLRLRERERRRAQLDRRHALIGHVRIALAAVFAIMAAFCFATRAASPLWLLVPAAGFGALVLYHQRVTQRRTRAERAADFYRAGLARMDDAWRGNGPAAAPVDVKQHRYAADLDLFGTGGLYQLLCAARTSMGETTLARWLLEPAALETIRERHVSIEELRHRQDLQEELAILGDVPRIELQSEQLIAWAHAPNRLDHAWIRWLGPLLGGLAAASAAVWGIWGIGFPLFAVVLAEIAVAYGLKLPIRNALAAVESAYEDLKGLSLLLQRIEVEDFGSAPLRAKVLALRSQGRGASQALSTLATIVNFVESRRNPLLAPLLLLLMYPLLAALAVERWRAAHGPAVRTWLEALGEVEALLSLARYAYERPADPYPEFIEGSASFQAEDLGHPLLAPAVSVGNDVAIGARSRLLLISGSNMSGKSTLLRAVGVNVVLAMAGAPIRATRLRLTPLQVGASIRVDDSLHEGSSRFYAEISRLRQLFEPTTLPLLFLLDELLQGTNSADRRIGAEGIIRALLKRGAIGLISTHDLALTEICALEPTAVENVHFQEELIEGRLKFDFKLRPGIVTRSNGIELMRSIGLDV
jgi:MutS domain V